MNLIESLNNAPTESPAATPVASPAATRVATAQAENSAVDDGDDGDDLDDTPPHKKQKTGRPKRSITPENDPWLLSPLLELAKSDRDAFARHELALLAGDRPLNEQLASVQTRKLNEEGLRCKDDAREAAKNELAKEKAARRKKPDKTVEDFKREADNETVDNDAEWVDFEQQQLNLRRKELSTQAFWKGQDKDTLKDVYKAVFPGISEASSHTKKAYMAVIAEYLKKDDGASRINIQAAVGIDAATSSVSAQRKRATRLFSATPVNQRSTGTIWSIQM